MFNLLTVHHDDTANHSGWDRGRLAIGLQHNEYMLEFGNFQAGPLWLDFSIDAKAYAGSGDNSNTRSSNFSSRRAPRPASSASAQGS